MVQLRKLYYHSTHLGGGGLQPGWKKVLAAGPPPGWVGSGLNSLDRDTHMLTLKKKHNPSVRSQSIWSAKVPTDSCWRLLVLIPDSAIAQCQGGPRMGWVFPSGRDLLAQPTLDRPLTDCPPPLLSPSISSLITDGLAFGSRSPPTGMGSTRIGRK